MAEKTLNIAVSNTSFGYDKLYSYRTGEELSDKCAPGMRVLVPFGNGNRKRIGLILSMGENPDKKLKPVISLIDQEPVIDDEMIDMIFWLKNTTFCTYFEAFRTVVPSGLGINFIQKYSLTGIAPENLDEDEQDLLDILSSAKSSREFDGILESLISQNKKNIIESLVSKNVIEEVNDFKRKVKDETIKMVCLSEEYLSNNSPIKITDRQKKVVEFIEQNVSASIKEVCYYCNVTPVIIKNLCKKNILNEYEYEEILKSDAEITEKIDEITLNSQQDEVFNGVSELIKSGKPSGALLYGITGSGKTAVFIKLIEYTLSLGKQAIMLIPEIALTPQMVHKFQNLFGERVAVIHSNLSLSQRLNEYKRIKNSMADIVVGTRSAVFSPLKNIGIIIMDEEGERTYKSEASPRYHARDIARKRCAVHNAVLLMASATPSVESFFYAKNNRYELFELTERYSDSTLPDVTIVDMASQPSSGLFSDILIDEINYNLKNKEQTVLLLNRRGYHTYISCAECRQPVSCPNCNIPLTYHKANGQLICHYCGYSTEMTDKCPKCGSTYLKQTGVGTQKIEDELSQYFSDARILRMDTDTTYSRYAYEKNFSDFKDGKYDIMIGTQMIAKGLDFPNVTLVGVLSVDKALFAGDFRSYERTFSLITQVVGRSGRGDKPGRAFLQTYVPDHYVLNLAAKQDYVSFYNEEIAIRKALIFPPYCDICVVYFVSLIEKEAETASKLFLNIMKIALEKNNISFPLRVLGPSKCSLLKINGKYRYRIILKTKNTEEFRKIMSDIFLSTFKYKDFSNVNISIDINGDII